MTNLSIYIVEDEPLYANQLMILVDELGYELAGMSDNSDKALKEIPILKPDLLLVDIKIKGTLDGIDFVSLIQKEIIIPTIFITSFKDNETFNRAKKVSPYAFLTKPFDISNLQRTIELAFNTYAPSENTVKKIWHEDIVLKDAFFIKNRNRLEKVIIEDILYLEVEDRYSTLYLENNKKYVLRMSMTNVQEKLPDNSFFRVHRKYSVNLKKVSSIDLQDNLVYMGDINVPVSRANKEELLEKIEWMK